MENTQIYVGKNPRNAITLSGKMQPRKILQLILMLSVGSQQNPNSLTLILTKITTEVQLFLRYDTKILSFPEKYKMSHYNPSSLGLKTNIFPNSYMQLQSKLNVRFDRIILLHVKQYHQMSNEEYSKLRAFTSYEILQGKQQIKAFLDFLKQKTNDSSIENNKCCFLVAENIIEAYMFVVFCFGEIKAVDYLPTEKISQSIKNELKKKLFKFNWDRKSPVLKIYSQNAQKFGEIYPLIKKEVINKMTEGQCLELFLKVKQTYLLNGVKIRKWQHGKYTQFKRNVQKNQIDRLNGTNYLLIAATKRKNYYVGVFTFTHDFDSLISKQWPQDPRNSQVTYVDIKQEISQDIVDSNRKQNQQINQSLASQKQTISPQNQMKLQSKNKQQQTPKDQTQKPCTCPIC